MESAVSTIAEQVRFANIQPVNDQGGNAKLDLSDGPIEVITIVGDAVGSIENYNEETGSFDVVLKPGTPGASTLKLSGDADMDSGEVREVTLEFNYTVNALEASGFQVGAGVVEPVTP